MDQSRVHPLIEKGQVFLSAGVYDVLSAKLAERAGFQSVVLTGYGVAASYLGKPDFGILTQSEMLDVARRVCRAVKVPVIVDGDTGYGSSLNVVRMVDELVAMGAKGILLEDQTWPKRCGHMRGKSVVSLEEHAQKIRAARETRGEAPFFITARTDARGPLGLDEAIARGKAYREAGADIIFVEAPESLDEMRQIVREVGGVLVVNMIEGGKTPIVPLEELQEMGFVSVGYVLSGLFAAAQALDQTYRHLLEHGSTIEIQDRLMGFDEFTEVVGLEDHYRLDERYSVG